MKDKIIYYQDELNDEFAGDGITPKKIDKNYVYLPKGIFKKITHFFWYRIVATPIAFMYMKLKFHHKIVNKGILKKYKKESYFIYGNHTHNLGDAFIPSLVTFPKETYLIVHANNVSMKALGKITPNLGAIPLPDDKDAYRNFTKCIDKRVKTNKCIMIYPEAHIWPFYTKIRPFKDLSFSYPIHYHCKVFSLTNVYLKRRFSKNPKMVTYIDGPFVSDPALPMKEQREMLRNQVYDQMVLRSKLNTVEIIKYIKKDV